MEILSGGVGVYSRAYEQIRLHHRCRWESGLRNKLSLMLLMRMMLLLLLLLLFLSLLGGNR